MSKTGARVARAEQRTHRRVLEELRQRRGFLRCVVFAADAEPAPDAPGEWRSDTVELLNSLPDALLPEALDAIGWEGWTVEPCERTAPEWNE